MIRIVLAYALLGVLVVSTAPVAAQEAAASSTTEDRVIQTDLDAPDIGGAEAPKPAPAAESKTAEAKPKPVVKVEAPKDSPQEAISESKGETTVKPATRPEPGKRVAAFWMMLPERS